MEYIDSSTFFSKSCEPKRDHVTLPDDVFQESRQSSVFAALSEFTTAISEMKSVVAFPSRLMDIPVDKEHPEFSWRDTFNILQTAKSHLLFGPPSEEDEQEQQPLSHKMSCSSLSNTLLACDMVPVDSSSSLRKFSTMSSSNYNNNSNNSSLQPIRNGSTTSLNSAVIASDSSGVSSSNQEDSGAPASQPNVMQLMRRYKDVLGDFHNVLHDLTATTYEVIDVYSETMK